MRTAQRRRVNMGEAQQVLQHARVDGQVQVVGESTPQAHPRWQKHRQVKPGRRQVHQQGPVDKQHRVRQQVRVQEARVRREQHQVGVERPRSVVRHAVNERGVRRERQEQREQGPTWPASAVAMYNSVWSMVYGTCMSVA